MNVSAPSSLLVACAVLVNSALAFVLACALIWPASRLAPTPSLRKWMLSVPLLKVFWDLAQGVPDNAYALSRFAGQRWELGSFQFGVGAKAPWSLLTLSARLGARHDDTWFALSGGDVPANALNHRGWGFGLLVIVAGVFLLSAARIWRHATSALHRRGLEAERRARARVLEVRRAGPWRVRVLESNQGGPAHVAGVLAPVIWLPERASAWSDAQREAVLQHELAHVRSLDLVLFGALAVCTRIFWFIPGLGWIDRKIRAAAEEAADAAAVKRGASGVELARAILAEGEHRAAGAHLGGSTAVARVRKLVEGPEPPRRALRTLRAALATYVVASVLASSFFGYH